MEKKTQKTVQVALSWEWVCYVQTAPCGPEHPHSKCGYRWTAELTDAELTELEKQQQDLYQQGRKDGMDEIRRVPEAYGLVKRAVWTERELYLRKLLWKLTTAFSMRDVVSDREWSDSPLMRSIAAELPTGMEAVDWMIEVAREAQQREEADKTDKGQENC